MQGKAEDVNINSDITYSLVTESFNGPLKLTNSSDITYVFKIKTNQKTVVSLQTTHDFLYPRTQKQIAIKLADKPSQTSQLKLEFNYAVANEDDIANKDSKMIGYPKQTIFRAVLPVLRQQQREILSEKQKEAPISQSKGEEHTPKIDLASLGKEKELCFDFSSGKSETVPEKKKLEEAAVELKKQVEFKKVESSEIKIESSVQREKDLGASQTLYFSTKEDSSITPLKSSPRKSKEKSEEETLLSNMEDKILKERATIKTLQKSNISKSILPLPTIFSLLILSFGLGSLFGYMLS